MESSDNIFNIMLATDIHLGCHEKDPRRGLDSFNTFEEILIMAKERDVDFILLGGDLFHESKPSPHCLHTCLKLLRHYCMGDKPIGIEFLSNPEEIFSHCANQIVNYEDPNLNISIPVFSIHGNHDDPSGFGCLSSLDLLSVSGLVNYFGKMTDLTQIRITPLLLRKGQSKLAIYGLSYIRDAKLARMFRDGKVEFLRPNKDPDDWMNILVLHQNRADNRGLNNFISDAVLPDFLDLVVWGHEHECKIRLEELRRPPTSKTTYITQPGSPVVTSLCEGEAVEKHVGILKIAKKKLRLDPIKLKTVRPFVFKSLNLASVDIGDKNSKHFKKKLENYLIETVRDMLASAKDQLTGEDKQPILPLIRLRVEYHCEEEGFNQIRFGQMFSEEVANPEEMILLKRSATGSRLKRGDIIDPTTMDGICAEEQSEFDREDNVDSTQKLDLILERYFNEVGPSRQLKVLTTKGLSYAVQRYVDSSDRDAIVDLVRHQMEKTQKHLKNQDNVTDENIGEHIESFRQMRLSHADLEAQEALELLNDTTKRENSKADNTSTLSSDEEGGEGNTLLKAVVPTPPKRGRGRAAASKPTRARGRGSRGSAARNNATITGWASMSNSQSTGENGVLNVTKSRAAKTSALERCQSTLTDMFGAQTMGSNPKRRKMEFYSSGEDS